MPPATLAPFIHLPDAESYISAYLFCGLLILTSSNPANVVIEG
nr:MAG TPA: hypothetical protein [Crassvirales sp.]